MFVMAAKPNRPVHWRKGSFQKEFISLIIFNTSHWKVGKIMDLGISLKQLRIERGLNQIDIANMLGVERSTYGKYETGDSSPDYDKLIQLSNFYQVSIDFLLGKTDIKNPIETIAAHHDGEEWTEEELEEIERFKEFVRMKRQQRDKE